MLNTLFKATVDSYGFWLAVAVAFAIGVRLDASVPLGRTGEHPSRHRAILHDPATTALCEPTTHPSDNANRRRVREASGTAGY